ncbi:DUF2142 domain-containing protein [Streptococcus sp. E24BD]
MIIGLLIVFLAPVTLPILFDFQYDIRFSWVVLGIVLYFLVTDFTQAKRLARNAFLFITIFGTVVALIRPVQYALDEETHLKNTIGLSGSFFFKYDKEELKDYDAVFRHDPIRNASNYQGKDYFDAVEHQDSTVAGEPVGFDNPAYLPGTIGWNLGELLSSKVKVSYYLGRIGTVIAYALLVFFAIHASKVYKEGIYLLGTLPSALYVTAGFHYDYLYYGVSLLFIAHLSNILAGYEKLTLKKTMLLQGLAFLLVFAKFPYVLLALLPLFVPNKYCSEKQVKPFAAINFLLIMIIAVVYSGIINVFKVSTFASEQSPGIGYFLTHPLPILRTLASAPFVLVDHFISRPLQYITHDSGFLMSMTVVLFFTMYILVSLKTQIRLPWSFQVLTGGLLIGISLLTIYAITGDPRVYHKGDVFVGGVQGRYYFFPLAILPLFLSDWIHRNFNLSPLSEENNQKFVAILQYVNTFLMILTISVALYTQL